ncbi:MAG: molybdenum cofactor guanylyltransferase MobA [Pseudomonadota bacterium]
MISAIVLCGGGGRRFAGRDKPLETLRGKALVEHVLERLTPQVDEVLISANRNIDRYERFGCPVLRDLVEDQGPLAGVVAAAAAAGGEQCFVCPGDAPLLAKDLVAQLTPALRETVDVVVPHDGARAQHLFMLFRTELAQSLPAYLATGARSVHGWLAGQRVAEVEVADPGSLFNVNTPEALQALEQSEHGRNS